MSAMQRTSSSSTRRLSRASLLFTIVITSLWSAFGLKTIPIADVQVVQKETANLPCDISLPDPRNDDVILVLWYREDLGRPIYSVDARDRSFQEAERWSDENVFGNRAYFRPNSRPAILAIENVQETDAAVYRCRVDFRVAQTRNAKVNLTVIVPPEQPTIQDETGKERKNLVGPYTEGSSLTLTCHVKGGKPLPRVIWYRNGKLIDSSDYYDEEDGAMKNELTIAILSRSDLHADLSCETYNNNVSTPLVTTVHVDMNFGPLEVKILDKSHQITAGRIYDIFCKAVGSRPQAVITWYLDGRRVEGGKEMTSKDGNATTSTLSYVPQKEDSGKMITCKAKNSAIPNINLEDSFTLQVMYLPIAQIKLGSSLKPDTIWEGTDLYFECHIEANPPVHKIDWRHNGKLLSHNKNAGVLISNQSLVLQKVTRLAAGNYTCIGRNTLGDGESQPFYLDILYSPACRPNQNRVHGVAKFENANITCDVDANPPQVKFRWTFNNSAESNEVPTSRYRSSGTRSIVTYTPMSELDYGTLLCWATNRIGDQRVPCVYHVIAAGRPDTVHNCTLANHSTDSFFLQCIEGFNGGLPQSFLLELVDSVAHKVRVNMTTSLPIFHVTGLEPGLSLQAHVYAFNNKGRSDPAIIPVFTLRLPEKILTREKEKPRLSQFEFSNTMKISIPIGVVAVLVLLSVIIISLRVYCSRRTSRDRRRREKASTPLKTDPPDGCDSDEKNPDVIPLDSDEVEYYRKRQQHISTIDTSPARVASSGLPGSYCTMRNGGIPMQDLNNIGARPKYMGGQETGYGTGYVGCPTLPRGHHHGHHGTTMAAAVESGHVSMEWPSYQGAAGISRRQPLQQTSSSSPSSSAAAAAADYQGQPQAQPSPQTSLLSHVHHHQQHHHTQIQNSNYATNPRLSSFRPSHQHHQPQQVSAGTSTNSSGLPFDIPPLLQIPVMEEDVDLTEIPLMTDKIESTV